MTLKCWSSSQVEKRFWSCMPTLKKITSPRPKKKKPKTTLKKREAQSPKQLGCKNKNKAHGVANEQMIETGQEPKLWAIERTRNKEIFEDHKNVKKNDWIQARDTIQIQGSRKPIHSRNTCKSSIIFIYRHQK